MIKLSGNFLLEHLEKIIFPIMGLLCLWLFVTRVLISPNCVEYDGRKFGPGDVDGYIRQQAENLEAELDVKPKPKESYRRQVNDFAAMLESTVNIDPGIIFPVPYNISADLIDDREYRLPSIGPLEDVGVEHIRAVAYIPTGTINEENTYDSAEHEPNDIDLVTVSAKLDIAGLYESFYESFAGDNVKAEWRDPCLAQPIFAAVQLQKQKLLGDSGWSDWQDVPRTMIDHQQKMLEIIEDIEKLPRGGMKVRLLRFNDRDVMMNLLQPEAYQIASAEEEWFPPELHSKFVKYRKADKEAERREARVKEKEERDREREDAARSRSERRETTTQPRTRGGGGDFGGMMMGGGGDFGGGGNLTPKRTTRPRERTERSRKERPEKEEQKETINDVYDELKELLIDDKTNLSKMQEPLVIWVHDDTVQPDNNYRYRIRLGVFNPIAGTNKLHEDSRPFKDKVILWSDFSEPTGMVEVPARLYFFPIDIQQAANTVKVEVAKYALGYWYSKAFMVEEGETIGAVAETELLDKEKGREIKIPESIDYSTEAVLVNTAMVDDWAGGKKLYPRQYFNMYYSFDGNDMEYVPIRQRFWASDMQNRYNEIKSSMKEPKEPLRAWGGKMSGRRRPSSPAGGMMDEMMMFEGFMDF